MNPALSWLHLSESPINQPIEQATILNWKKDDWRRGLKAVAIFLATLSLAVASRTGAAQDIDSDELFAKDSFIVSVEAGANRFGVRLENPDGIQTWDLVARLSIVPFGLFRFPATEHLMDGALAIGIEPVFQRFNSQSQNYGGGGLDLRYYFAGLRIGSIIPWVDLMGSAGGTDLQVSRLNGPFMFLLQGGVGFSYLVTERWAWSLGYQAEHLSNGGTEPGNNGLNSPAGAVIGTSYFF